VSKIPDGAVVVVSGFNVANAPFYLLDKLLERYKETGHPKRLFIVSDVLPAIPGFGLDKIGEFIVKERPRLCERISSVLLRVGSLASERPESSPWWGLAHF